MKKQTLIYLFLLLAACQKPSQKTVFEQINDEVLKNSKAYTTLQKATDSIGHRLTGSENGSKAENYVYALFKNYGFDDVQFQEFSTETWLRNSVSVQISAVGANDYQIHKSVALGHTPVQANIEAVLVDAGSGLKADFEKIKDHVKDKIALVYLGVFDTTQSNLHRSEKTALAIQYGAKGVVFYNQVQGDVLLTGTASVDGKLVAIPAVCISNKDGESLKERLTFEKLTVRIQMQNEFKRIQARNVVATWKGTDLEKEKIVVCGHLDSWDLATGAIDNGIGSFAIIDIARTLQALQLKTKRTIQFVLFMGEEQGLLGSKYFVEQAQKQNQLADYRYVINIDMAGNPIGFSSGGRPEAIPFCEQIGKKINAVDTIFRNKVGKSMSLHSDHQSFLLEGIPYIGLMSNLDEKVYDCYHADCDEFGLVNEKHLQNTVRFSTMLLYELANADQLPANVLDSENTKKLLIDNDLKEKLELGGEWKWEK